MPDDTERRIVEVHDSLRIFFQTHNGIWTLIISCSPDDKRCEDGFQLKNSYKSSPFEFFNNSSLSSRTINGQVNDLKHKGNKYKLIFQVINDDPGSKSDLITNLSKFMPFKKKW